MPTRQRTFPGDPQELRTARNWTRATLNDHPQAEEAALIVTELGTNAVVHTASGDAAGAFHVTLTVSEATITIEVTDSGHAKSTPEIQLASLTATHGRGLGMVAALADSLTVKGDDSGRTVTAELHVRASLQEPTPCP
ncbi:ATP-binding protein [Streptomyces hyaluromycini]|uniref:ATP-binding protein n=1 Tax=Streptomyces hyaluromycini TaxID=1377993 RepID=UPI001FE3D9A7|nr:ATP-binding protein [Streptomyces hyaluromycini]